MHTSKAKYILIIIVMHGCTCCWLLVYWLIFEDILLVCWSKIKCFFFSEKFVLPYSQICSVHCSSFGTMHEIINELYKVQLFNIGSVGQYKENTRWVSFDIKFSRQGFENACWITMLCRVIQCEFSKSSLVNLISKDSTWYSIYQLISWFTHQSSK